MTKTSVRHKLVSLGVFRMQPGESREIRVTTPKGFRLRTGDVGDALIVAAVPSHAERSLHLDRLFVGRGWVELTLSCEKGTSSEAPLFSAALSGTVSEVVS